MAPKEGDPHPTVVSPGSAALEDGGLGPSSRLVLPCPPGVAECALCQQAPACSFPATCGHVHDAGHS